MSFFPRVDQFAIVVKTASLAGETSVFQKSVTTGWRVGSHAKPCSGTGNELLPIFSPKVNSALMMLKVSTGVVLALINVYLLDARVTFDVNQPLTLEKVLVQFVRPANIKDGISLAIEFSQACQMQSETLCRVEKARRVRPTISKIE